MRLTGTLKSWNDDRGFGFIAPTHGGAELFMHISALPRDGSRPTVGERLTYEIGRNQSGKPHAINVLREALNSTKEPPHIRRFKTKQNSSLLSKLLVLVVLLALGVFAYSQYKKQYASSPLQSHPLISKSPAPVGIATYKCDGRKHCSQMTSCAEAKFFLQNCPDTQMDGNHDGTPCEQQWCTGLFGR